MSTPSLHDLPPDAQARMETLASFLGAPDAPGASIVLDRAPQTAREALSRWSSWPAGSPFTPFVVTEPALETLGALCGSPGGPAALSIEPFDALLARWRARHPRIAAHLGALPARRRAWEEEIGRPLARWLKDHDREDAWALEGGEWEPYDEDDEEDEAPAAPDVATLTLRLMDEPDTRGGLPAALQAMGQSAGPARLIAVAAAPPEALALLGFGGWSDCPPSAEHASAWSAWGQRHGARPVLIEPDRLQGVVERPPQGTDALLELTEALALYDPDLLAEGVLDLAWSLNGAHRWGFWWD